MVTHTTLKTDLCVAGGGIAGVCTALAAARNGARVVLIQDRSVLGGNASSDIHMHMVGASCSGQRPGARESGIIDELRVQDAVRNPQRSNSMWDLVVEETVLLEIKAVRALHDVHLAQCLNYLKATGLKIGLLLNFARPRLEVKRVVHNL